MLPSRSASFSLNKWAGFDPMAITAFTGVPGSGKSYALVEQVILPAVLAGRRVVTNVEGLDPDRVHDWCAAKVSDPDKLGEVIKFDGDRATKSGFFPTEEIADTDTVIKGGDYIVFDEWRLYWPRRGTMPSPDLEPFLRWHRHLTNAKGHSTDLAIGTQLPTDVCQDFRGLIERSYKFRKLKAVGAPKLYAWDVYEGHLQPKGGAYKQGNGKYKPDVFALYKSYTAGEGSEDNNDKRLSMFSKSFVAIYAGGAAMILAGAVGAYRFFTRSDAPPIPVSAPQGQPGQPGRPMSVATPTRSPYRIVGTILGDLGTRVIVSDDNGATRVLPPGQFEFDNGRPVSGIVDGKQVLAEDRVIVSAPNPLGGVM